MNQNWHGTLIRHMLLLTTVCLLAGLISGYYGWSLAIGLALYLGWTHERIRGDDYLEFVDLFVAAVRRRSRRFVNCIRVDRVRNTAGLQ
mgnify:CR=1 FL=1